MAMILNPFDDSPHSAGSLANIPGFFRVSSESTLHELDLAIQERLVSWPIPTILIHNQARMIILRVGAESPGDPVSSWPADAPNSDSCNRSTRHLTLDDLR
jgi:hypothetical protein